MPAMPLADPRWAVALFTVWVITIIFPVILLRRPCGRPSRRSLHTRIAVGCSLAGGFAFHKAVQCGTF
jgi:hypothetical protein